MFATNYIKVFNHTVLYKICILFFILCLKCFLLNTHFVPWLLQFIFFYNMILEQIIQIILLNYDQIFNLNNIEGNYLLIIPCAIRSKNSISSCKYSEMEIKQIIFGSLLGDGQLELLPRALNARFKFTQSLKQEPYFLMVWNILSHFSSSDYKLNAYLDERTGKIYSSLNFRTKSLPLFTEFWSMFYINGKLVLYIVNKRTCY